MSLNLMKKLAKKKIEIQFDNAYNDYFVDILKYCCVRLYSDDATIALDCVQETFTLLYKKMNDGEEFNHIRGWLYRTVDNFIKRENSASIKRSENIYYINDLDIDNTLYCEYDYLDLLTANKGINIDKCMVSVFDRLNFSERMLYQKRYKERVPVSTLAKQLNISETALTSRICRLKKKIQVIVSEIIEQNYNSMKVGGVSNE
ncbi:MAG: sigma-70 family RNA polymerase sigma factor [Oscillospiraceae bacterium]|nr:sigma-70 family RNA polymerase sigma factor [Oscillospiraceae bacterium]